MDCERSDIKAEDIPCAGNADEVLRLALDIAEHILENGGEVSRVESTIEHIGYALGAAHVEAFAVTTLITASVRMADGSYSQQMRRVKNTEVNLYRVEELNEISREVCSGAIDIAEAHEKLAAVTHKSQLAPWVVSCGYALTAMGFVIYFGGSLRDALISAVIGILMMFIRRDTDNAFNAVAQTAVRSFFAGVLAMASTRLGLGENANLIMIGTIMLLIPGMAIGTSIGDMLGKNIISGTMRLAQALIQTVVIALGYAAAMLIFGGAV